MPLLPARGRQRPSPGAPTAGVRRRAGDRDPPGGRRWRPARGQGRCSGTPSWALITVANQPHASWRPWEASRRVFTFDRPNPLIQAGKSTGDDPSGRGGASGGRDEPPRSRWCRQAPAAAVILSYCSDVGGDLDDDPKGKQRRPHYTRPPARPSRRSRPSSALVGLLVSAPAWPHRTGESYVR